MQRKIISVTLFVLATLAAFAQNSTETGKGILNLRFLDDKTGMVAIPDYIDLKQRENIKNHYIIRKDSSSKGGNVLFKNNGKLQLIIPDGAYDGTVHKRGYKPMPVDFVVNDSNNEFNYNIYLIPLKPAKEATPDYYKPLKKKEAMLMHGFIMDDSTGKPLEGVMIYSADKVAQGKTDSRGYFEFDLPLPADKDEIEGRGTIFFEKEGYITEVRSNFDMGPKMSGPHPTRMKPGNGINRKDLFKDSNRGSSRMTLEDVKRIDEINEQKKEIKEKK